MAGFRTNCKGRRRLPSPRLEVFPGFSTYPYGDPVGTIYHGRFNEKEREAFRQGDPLLLEILKGAETRFHYETQEEAYARLFGPID